MTLMYLYVVQFHSFIQVEFLTQTGRVSVRLELFCLRCRHLKYKYDHVTSDSIVRHFSVRQRSCGKVMFSVVCVCHVCSRECGAPM